MKQAKRQSGFTLLELLVGLILMGLLAVLLATSMRSGLDVTQRVETRASDTQAMVDAHATFLDLIETAFPSRSTDAHGANMRFDGSARSIDLLGPSRAETTAGLTARGLDVSNNQMALTSARGERRVIAALPAGAALAYFGATERGQAADWRDAWTGQEAFPLLVRLRVPGWPDAIARPRAKEAIR